MTHPALPMGADTRVSMPDIGRIIDVHSHALLPVWREAAARAQGKPAPPPEILGRAAPEWTETAHLEMMDAHGIAMSILSWPSATECVGDGAGRDLARAINEEFASIVDRHPDRFGAFAALPLDDVAGLAEETAYALDVLGLDGISCTPHMLGNYLGAACFDDWFAELDRRKAILFVHPVVPPGADAVASVLHPAILEFMFDTTRMIANLVFSGARRKFPDIRIICTHGGGAIPYLAHRIGVLGPTIGALFGGLQLSREEIFAGLASFHFDLTASTSHAQLRALLALVPPSRLMLGFDYPLMPARTIAPALDQLQSCLLLDHGDREAIIRGTALALLPAAAARLSAYD